MDDTGLTICLWGATALLLGWTWLPALIAGLGGTRYAIVGVEDPSALPPTPEPDFAFWANQIETLGYIFLGTGSMRLTFHGPDWRYESRVRVFYSRSKHSYAFIQQQPRPLDVWWLTVFATCWVDGGVLLSGNAVNEEPGAGDYVVQGLDSTNLMEVENMHLRQRDLMVAAGQRVDPDGSLETLLAALRRHAGPAVRHVGVKLGQNHLAAHLMVHLVLSVPIVALFSLGHWSLPLVNLALAALLAFGEYVAKRRAAANLRMLAHFQR